MAVTRSDTKATTRGEFVYEMFSEVHCTKSVIVENDTTVGAAAALDATEAKNPVGQPVYLNSGVWEIADEPYIDAGNISGIIIDEAPLEDVDGTPLAANETSLFKRTILVKGPATINDNKIPAKDLYGTSLDATAKTNYITAVNALGIEVRDVGGQTTQQTT